MRLQSRCQPGWHYPRLTWDWRICQKIYFYIWATLPPLVPTAWEVATFSNCSPLGYLTIFLCTLWIPPKKFKLVSHVRFPVLNSLVYVLFSILDPVSYKSCCVEPNFVLSWTDFFTVCLLRAFNMLICIINLPEESTACSISKTLLITDRTFVLFLHVPNSQDAKAMH